MVVKKASETVLNFPGFRETAIDGMFSENAGEGVR
jgi:hypothetical protein